MDKNKVNPHIAHAQNENDADWKFETKGTPLSGLKVLELGNMIAAPTAGCLMGDFGASVVKVEHPEMGDDLRQWPPFGKETSLWWKVTNRNKKLITLNLSKPEGQELLLRMLPEFDVVIENFRPGTLERWNIGYAEMQKANPKVVLVRISGYGQYGPYSSRPGYGTVAEALSGIPSFTGAADGPPTLSAFPLVDALAGMFAVQGAMMAIYERDIGGSNQGQMVDVSLYESLFRLADAQVIGYAQNGIVKERNGNRMAEDSPRNTYLTLDGEYVAVSAGSQKTFNRLSKAMGMDLSANEKFSTTSLRVTNDAELDGIVGEWFLTKTLKEALAILEENDVVAGPVYNIEQIFKDEHFRVRENIIDVKDEELGSVKMHGITPKFSRTPGAVRKSAGTLGLDTESFYLETLKLDAEEFKVLQSRRIV